jgi:hypothetical protein
MIKPITFDLLDASYTNKVVDYLSLNDDLRYKNSEETFILDPNYWEKYHKIITQFNCNFNWNEFKFDSRPDLNSLILNNDIGLYMFVIKPLGLIYDLPKFIIYVGISGEKGSNRPLKERLNDYLNYNNIKKRKKLHRLLSKYYAETYVVYTTVNVSWQNLEEIEKALHGFFVPIANDRDFPIQIKKIKNAF